MASDLDLAHARAYWDKAAQNYDRDFSETRVGRLWRRSVWKELDRCFLPGQKLLELNCGTGADAVHLAGNGMRVVACDLSPNMIELAALRAKQAHVVDRIDFRVQPNETIGALEDEGKFDGALSNFSGLNCVANLSVVFRDLGSLLKPEARVVLCMLGHHSLWRIVRNIWKALHRSTEVTPNIPVRTISITELDNLLSPHFAVCSWKGIGVTLPPSYMNAWVCRHPRATTVLALIDEAIGRFSPFRHVASCVVVQLKRTNSPEPR